MPAATPQTKEIAPGCRNLGLQRGRIGGAGPARFDLGPRNIAAVDVATRDHGVGANPGTGIAAQIVPPDEVIEGDLGLKAAGP